MKTKPVLSSLSLSLLLSVSGVSAEAQSSVDTLRMGNRTIVVKEDKKNINVQMFSTDPSGKSFENKQIFKGVYLNGRSMEQHYTSSILGTLRISLEKPVRHKKRKEKPRYMSKVFSAGGFGLGAAILLGDGKEHLLNAASLRYTIGLASISMPLSKHWVFKPGANIEFNSIHMDKDYAYHQQQDKTVLLPAPEGEKYKTSRLHITYLTFPIMIRYRTGEYLNFGIDFGPELKIRTASSSKVWHRGQNGYTKLGSDLFLNTVGVGLRAQVSHGNIGFYGTYDLTPTFRNGYGPSNNILSVGAFLNL
ncbi:hypothetical protein PORCRE_1123 [Porphyromonas crevioricanis JCM 15906]|uniref:Outer membrane protein beta-barrel domain-containing protein n=1 Tax=Porphyromonas crevioricanis JCM 15906 TaxID=1305617 RepID=T1CHL5_9PORP|nr:outer membrane beta-barrel protein [Porphyromonas crevioricanis]GAD05421.1 hypothetical protein PORCRE_1123 [Porphyromonas crevioricanis JCM 15906]SJZ89447.1 Outer membrane protein beta-barrel domain-containing protein [Porphyromonas crevioricanis]